MAADVSTSGLVRCLDAYVAFKAKHYVKPGWFYIVHDGAVLNIPFESREDAKTLMRKLEKEGGNVRWHQLLILEAGNEWGERRKVKNVYSRDALSRAASRGREIVDDIRNEVKQELEHNSAGLYTLHTAR